MDHTGYTSIPDWMLSYDLDIYETIILAVIFGFSQDGDSTFSGSQNYLARKAKCTRRKVAMALPKLVDMGLVIKIDKDILKALYADKVEEAIRAAHIPAYIGVSLTASSTKANELGVLEGDEEIFNTTEKDTVTFRKPKAIKE